MPLSLTLAIAGSLVGLALCVWGIRRIISLSLQNRDDAMQLQAAASQIAHLQSMLEQATGERSALQEKLEQLQTDKERWMARHAEAEKISATLQERLQDQEKRLEDWERLKQESLHITKASVLEAGHAISNKLIEDHKRETEAARKEMETRIQQTTHTLSQHFQTITQSVGALQSEASKQQQRLETVWQALSTPAGVGQFTELGLESLLKACGLEAGRDYWLQFHVGNEEGANLRPDAILFLPDDTVLVIDCKASKALLELASAATVEDEALVLQRLKKTMQQHLQGLTRKEYRKTVETELKNAGHGGRIRQSLGVMYLPNEAAIEKIRAADPDFSTRAQHAGITLAGPATLAALLSFACLKITFQKQMDNQEKIVEATRRLLDGLGPVLEHAEKLGKGVRQAAEAFDKFARSANKFLLPRARDLAQLGVESSRHKTLPVRLPVWHEDALVVDQTAENEDSGGVVVALKG
jgi:DNA recombination protein RmuC